MLQALYRSTKGRTVSPWELCLDDFLNVENEIIRRWQLSDSDPEHLAHASARNSGEALQTLCTSLEGYGLLRHKVHFKTRIPLQRREIVDRHREPFKKRRQRLFPEPDVFYFLAELANKPDLEPYWRIRLRAIELQIALGRRVSEILTLPEDCLIRDEQKRPIGVCYVPGKRAEPYVAWIPQDKHFETASQMVERAVKDIQALCKPAREIAAAFAACRTPNDICLPRFKPAAVRSGFEFIGLKNAKPEEFLLRSEFQQLFGHEFTSYLKAHGIPYLARVRVRRLPLKLGKRACKIGRSVPIAVQRKRILRLLRAWKKGAFGKRLTWSHIVWQTGCSSGLKNYDPEIGKAFRDTVATLKKRWPEEQAATTVVAMVRVGDIKRFLFETSRRDLVVREGDGQKRLLLSNALFAVLKWQLSPSRTPTKLIAEPLKKHHLSVFLRGAKRIPSVFEAFGRPDLAAKSHGFRRWVTTEGRRAGINNLVLARWLGRSTVQNDVYDYNEPAEFKPAATLLYKAIQNVHGAVKDVVTDMAAHGIPLVEREAFLAAELNGIMSTDKGGCSHEWAITPCQKSRACYNDCSEFYVIKGRVDHYKKALTEKPKIERALQLSREQVGDAYYANGYVQLYQKQLKTVIEVIRIHQNASIPDGTLVQVSSFSSTRSVSD